MEIFYKVLSFISWSYIIDSILFLGVTLYTGHDISYTMLAVLFFGSLLSACWLDHRATIKANQRRKDLQDARIRAYSYPARYVPLVLFWLLIGVCHAQVKHDAIPKDIVPTCAEELQQIRMLYVQMDRVAIEMRPDKAKDFEQDIRLVDSSVWLQPSYITCTKKNISTLKIQAALAQFMFAQEYTKHKDDINIRK